MIDCTLLNRTIEDRLEMFFNGRFIEDKVRREIKSTLIDFRATQCGDFDADAWLGAPHPNRNELLAAVLFLAEVDWYGNRSSLRQVASELEPGAIGPLRKVAQRTNFDMSRPSTLLRRKLNHKSVLRAF